MYLTYWQQECFKASNQDAWCAVSKVLKKQKSSALKKIRENEQKILFFTALKLSASLHIATWPCSNETLNCHKTNAYTKWYGHFPKTSIEILRPSLTKAILFEHILVWLQLFNSYHCFSQHIHQQRYLHLVFAASYNSKQRACW